MLGQRRSPSESPPSSNSEDSRRKRRRRVSSSSEDTSDNEDAETGHWKSKNKYRRDEDEDMSRPWRRQKVDAFTRRISDFSEDKKRRMPANVKTISRRIRKGACLQRNLPLKCKRIKDVTRTGKDRNLQLRHIRLEKVIRQYLIFDDYWKLYQ
ncbi:hypothetical protein Tco_0862799, partial [Tanacetum coccineum]